MRGLLRPALFGFLNGYVILHPAAMLIFRLLEDTQEQCVAPTLAELARHAFVHSFQPAMLPMGLAFGLVGAAVGLAHGYQSQVIRRHRDDLRRQLDRNETLVQQLRNGADQLRAQNDHLVELERAKRRMTHFLVHDFKTHLNCIELLAETLSRDEQAVTGAEHRDALRRIRRQAGSILVLVNNLLDLARLEDAPALRTERASLDNLLAAVAEDAAIAGRGGPVTVDGASRSCPPVEIEPALIYRVLLNLVSNAIKHNRAGTRVRLGAALAADGQAVMVTCSDDGAGIAPDRLPTLFEPFQAGELAPAASTGLGLAFARSAVEAHGGHIWCESTPGRGARFCFTLPVAKEATDMNGPDRTRRRVLVVDDEADFAALMDAMLRELGYEVGIASDADEALAQVKAARPDVITLDISMPRKSGALFYRRLKSQKAWLDIPVIVVTGLRRADPEMDGIIRSFLETDRLPKPQAYLDKPVTRAELSRVMAEVLAAGTVP
ncbi:MAG: ATP-binding protein [Planctomycetota bacterium]